MAPPNISTHLALESDAPALASLMTSAFSASDAAYPLIWDSAPLGTHDKISIAGLFTPVQKEGRVTWKAFDEENGRIVGFATWSFPKPKVEREEQKKGGGIPNWKGVNMSLFEEKIRGPKEAYFRDVDGEKDMLLNFCFVHPEYQRQGIASLLMNWGTEKADDRGAKLWVMGTPQAIRAYEKSGFKVFERHEVDLAKFGGKGIYSRAWMLRLPLEKS